MKFLEIKSRGEMAPQALSLIGASTKRGDDSTIGMFGSGLKYAIASVTRQDIPFMVFSGKREIKITTKEVIFADKPFNVICIDGKETSLTDSMGTEDWAGVFPFIREIYSNAIDEDENATIKIVDNVFSEAGYTKYYINATPDILLLIANFKDYFPKANDALFSSHLYGDIHTGGGNIRLFRKGILSYHEEREKSLFNYNLLNVEINESRILRNIYDARNKVGYLIESCTEKGLLRRWIRGLSGSDGNLFEHSCILSEWQTLVDNPVLVDVILESKYYPMMMDDMLDTEDKKGRVGLPLDVLSRFLKYAPDADILGLNSQGTGATQLYVEKTPSPALFDKVADSLSRLKKTKYSSRIRNEIKYCKFNSQDVLGTAAEKTIWLSIKLEDYSIDEISKIIIEEQEHLISGYGDETRQFQNHLFNLYYDTLTQPQIKITDSN